MKLNKYWSSNCQQCSLKRDCTPGPQLRVARWVLDEIQARLDHAPEMMRIRRQTVEHPFGTIEAWMGATHFQTKTIERVSTEMSLHVRGDQATRSGNGYDGDAGVMPARDC
ncbi:hypothetical protein M3I56_20195 [Paraburkholderia sp. CNPSo 3281]|nr:hypothetical protein [Paraburkholderia sp. CNPSo 3281]